MKKITLLGYPDNYDYMIDWSWFCVREGEGSLRVGRSRGMAKPNVDLFTHPGP